MASPAIIALVAKLGPKIFDLVSEFITDKDKAKELAGQLTTFITDALGKSDAGQIEINKEEIKHRSIFVAGWRPFIGWNCGVGISYHFLIMPLVNGILAITYHCHSVIPEMSACGQPPQMPHLEIGELLTLVMGMLGLGVYRTYEKVNNVTGN